LKRRQGKLDTTFIGIPIEVLAGRERQVWRTFVASASVPCDGRNLELTLSLNY
jgi:hypothetical protein